jgi:hypothetical protein
LRAIYQMEAEILHSADFREEISKAPADGQH